MVVHIASPRKSQSTPKNRRNVNVHHRGNTTSWSAYQLNEHKAKDCIPEPYVDMKKCMIAKLRRWWNRRSYYVYISEDVKQLSSYHSPEESNQGVPEQTIITDSSQDSTPDFDTSTVYTPGEIPRLITKVTSGTTTAAATTTRSSQTEKGSCFGIDQMLDYFVSSRSCASLCSMDSLTDSNWGPSWKGSVAAEEDLYQSLDDDFFNEHVRFLRIQTAPQQVKAIWSPPSGPPRTRGRVVGRLLCEV